MSEYDFVGVDISKLKFDAAVTINERTISRAFDNNPKGFKQFSTWLEKEVVVPWVCLEATGIYSEGLAEYLFKNAIKVSVVNPMQIRNFAKSILSRNKNDKLDAQIIALFARKATLRCFKPRSIEKKYLREMVQLMETLTKQCQQFMNQLESIQSKEAKKSYQAIIRMLEKRIKTVEIKIELHIQKNSEQLLLRDRLTSIIGIGEKTAHALMAYLPDIELFSNAKQLAAFAGLSPRQHQSGKFTGTTKLSKFGNPALRKALYMPALVVKKHNDFLTPFCKRLERNGLKPKAIVGAIMRKLLHIIYGMLKNKKEFDPALV